MQMFCVWEDFETLEFLDDLMWNFNTCIYLYQICKNIEIKFVHKYKVIMGWCLTKELRYSVLNYNNIRLFFCVCILYVHPLICSVQMSE